MTEPLPPLGTVRKILVTGDVVVDHQIYVGQKWQPNSTLRQGTSEVQSDGGAALLHDLLQTLCETAEEPASPASGVLTPFDVALGVERPTTGGLPAAFHGFGVFEPFPRLSHQNAGKVWRLANALGFGEEPLERYAPAAERQALDGDYDVVVIDDAGLGYRVQTASNAWPRILRDAQATWPEWLVLKLSAPVACGDLWRKLAATEANGEHLRDRCIVIVSINDLRAEGVQVPQALSWEQSALDLTTELIRNPRLKALTGCRYVIVAFQSDGALLADFSRPDEPVFRLLFDPASLEGDWDEAIPGKIYGLQTCLAAVVVSGISHRNASSLEVRHNLERGIQAGLAGMRRLLTDGHGSVGNDPPAFPFATVTAEVRAPTWQYSVATVPALTEPHRKSWTILEGDESSSTRSTPLFGTARRVALRGASELRHVPHQQFGALLVIERKEIERLRTLRQLVCDYACDNRANKPLSIAVFGPPGAGKSFGVKQLAKSVLSSKTPILEFNLAQFTEPTELIGLLHQVRDKVLEGHLPVVFWDEFDSRELMWLQYLLAPMQDGRFQDGQLSHPIGKCIFIFAGGTSYDFDSFKVAPTLGNASDTEQQRWKHFKARKGPDFVSRLNGFLNVLGPNKRQTFDAETQSWRDDPADVSYPIRRALFLRAKLATSSEQRVDLDEGVLTALLEVGRYLHGSRSLEKILEHLRQSGRTGVIKRSDLPPAHLLALHVDDSEFLQLVERDVKFQGDVEQMAEAYHEFYRARYPGGQYDAAYSTLPAEIKEDNRAAARRIVEVLALSGLYVMKDGSSDTSANPGEIESIVERNLEILSEAEHDGWLNHKLRQGWRCVADKSMRSDEKRLHDLLIPYRDLPNEEREKGRGAVRSYSEIVARQGYRIVCEPPVTGISQEP